MRISNHPKKSVSYGVPRRQFLNYMAMVSAIPLSSEYLRGKINFSPNGFLTVEEKDLKIIFLGFEPNLIKYQLQIINNLKNELKKNNFTKKIDNIDLTNPNKPKIKVFKP